MFVLQRLSSASDDDNLSVCALMGVGEGARKLNLPATASRGGGSSGQQSPADYKVKGICRTIYNPGGQHVGLKGLAV